MPEISVIMPAYNAELYIKEAIESILNQTFSDFEFLIYNDGSLDKTNEIILAFSDTRIVYKNIERNAGYLNLLNDGLRIAKGRYIARMDADDIAMPTRFEEQYKFLEDNPDVGICGSFFEFIGTRSGPVKMPITSDDVVYKIFFGSPVCHPTAMMRNSLLKKYCLKYDPDFYLTEDYKLFSEAVLCFKVVNIPKILIKYRSHSLQVSTTKWRIQFSHICQIQTSLFSKCIIEIEEEDFHWLYSFFLESSIPDIMWLKQAEQYKNRIIDGNKINSIFSQQILEKALEALFPEKIRKNFYKYYFNKYYNQKRFSPALLLSFLKEKYKPYHFLGKKLTVYFVIKCLVGYSKKHSLAQ